MVSLQQIAELTGARLVARQPERTVSRLNTLEDAQAGEVSFLAQDKYFHQCEATRADAVIVNSAAFERLKTIRADLDFLITENPYLAFAKVLHLFDRSPQPVRRISPQAFVAETAEIASEVGIYPGAYVGERVKIGKGSVIYPNCTLEDDVIIGENCTIYANVVIRYQSLIGNSVIIHSGTVIGSDGFGFAPDEQTEYQKIPQIGRVVIADSVEIGSNVSIDRAVLGETYIGKGVKLDNLIQVGHNVRIGDHTVIAAQTGISGSTRIGSRNMIGGQVGFAGHQTIGNRVMIAAKSGVHNNIEDDSVLLGYPARPIGLARRIEASLNRLPEYLSLIRQIAKKLDLPIPTGSTRK
ncbi:MAG: UDP-3-O-(3-hydroxymyristoyl)glucosamine N-acyltransferase [Candidatus Delongbacteria bacterium]|nr:UDP-3-O-(3-hydroxymyristoyl)glucosamine N-acyltransferase [Candidatus Delongbacteria bacterium]